MILWTSRTGDAPRRRRPNPDPLGVAVAGLMRAVSAGFGCMALAVGLQTDAPPTTDATPTPLWALWGIAGVLVAGAVLCWRVADNAEFLPEPIVGEAGEGRNDG